MMDEVKNETQEKTFTFVMTRNDVNIILAGLGELPLKVGYELMKKLEMLMMEQSKPKENDNT